MRLTTLPRFILICNSLVVGAVLQVNASDLIVANVVISNAGQSSATESKENPSTETSNQELPISDAPETEPVATTDIDQPSPEGDTPLTPPVKILKNKSIKAEAPLKYKLNNKAQLNSKADPKPRKYELHGYVNNKYVYLIVEKAKANDQQVVGYMFDGKGKKKYVYGEWVNKTLQIYDPSNKKSTVLLNDSSNQSTTSSLFGNEKQFIEQSESVK